MLTGAVFLLYGMVVNVLAVRFVPCICAPYNTVAIDDRGFATAVR